MSELWGEIPTVPETDSGIAAIEREQITKPRSMEVEGPPLFQPSCRHHPPSNEPLPARWFQIDPLTLHTIRLIQHVRKTGQAIQQITQLSAQSDGKCEPESIFPVLPPIPEYTGPPLKYVQTTAIPYMPANFESNFAKGIGESPPAIDEIANRKLLRRSVAAILAHLSFEGSPESVLETLTDVTHEYYLQFMKHLRSAADSAAMHGQLGFPDIIERVFHEMGIGSVSTLHEFYQTRVISYHRNMFETCKQLVADYEKLRQPSTIKSPTAVSQKDTLRVIRIKEEPSTEIQFPVLDENDEVGEAEHLLQLEGLGTFEITVEQEAGGGLTTEVDSKWGQTVKVEPSDKQKIHEGIDNPSSIPAPVGSSGQDSVPPTPRPLPELIPDSADGGQGPRSEGTLNTHSPQSPNLLSAPSKAKRKKTL